MSEHIKQGDLSICLCVGHLKIGEKLLWRIFQRQLAHFGANYGRQSRESFGARTYSKERVGCYRKVRLQVAKTKSFQEDDLILMDDHHGQTGNLQRLALFFY